LVCKVNNLTGETQRYHGDELILGTELTPVSEKSGTKSQIAYVLRFDLPRGTYASILIREFLRRDV